MEAAEPEDLPIQQYLRQLEQKGIQVIPGDRFDEFWIIVLHHKELNYQSESMIREFVPDPTQWKQFTDFCLEKLNQKKQKEYQVKEEPKEIQPTFDLSYDKSGVNQNVMVMIISDCNIKTVEIRDSQGVQKENKKNEKNPKAVTLQTMGFKGYSEIIPINFNYLPAKLKTISVFVEFSWSWLSSNQKKQQKLQDKIKWQLSKGVIQIVHFKKESKEDVLQAFRKKFILKISQGLFISTESEILGDRVQRIPRLNELIWKEIKPWFYLLHQIYKPCQPAEIELLDEMVSEKQLKLSDQFTKFLIWLLKNIFGTEYKTFIQSSIKLINMLAYPDKYQFPEDDSEEIKVIECQYLRTLFLTVIKKLRDGTRKDKQAQTDKKVIKVNIEHQGQTYQRQQLEQLMAFPKLAEELKDLVQQKYITNKLITVKHFVEHYLNFCRITQLDTLNQKSIQEGEESRIVLKFMNLLLKKCQIFGIEAINQQNPGSNVTLEEVIDKILSIESWTTSEEGNSEKRCRFRVKDQDFLELIKIVAKICEFKSCIGESIISILTIQREYNIRKLFMAQFQNTIKVFLKFKHPKMQKLLIKFAFSDCQNNIQRLSNDTKQSLLEFLEKYSQQFQSRNKCLDQLRQQLGLQKKEALPQEVIQPLSIAHQPNPSESSILVQQQPQPIIPQYPINPRPRVEPKFIDVDLDDQKPFTYQRQINIDPVDQQIKKEQEKKKKKVLFLLIFESANKVERLMMGGNEIVPEKRSVKKIEKGFLSYLFYRDFDLNALKRGEITANKHILKADNLQIDSDERCALLYFSTFSNTLQKKRLIEMQLFTIVIIMTNNIKKDIRNWVSIVSERLKILNAEPELLINQLKQQLKKIKELSIEAIYVIICLIQKLFETQVMKHLRSLFNQMSKDLKIIVTSHFFRTFSENSRQDIEHLRYICLLLMDSTFYLKNISITKIKQCLSKGFKMITLELGKQLIRELMDKNLSNVMVDSNQMINSYSYQSPFVSGLQLFFIRCFYLSNLMGANQEQNIIGALSHLLEMVNQKQKNREKQHKSKITIELTDQIASEKLSQLFFKSQPMYSSSLDPFQFNEEDKTFIFQKDLHIQYLYQLLKSIQVEKVHQIMTSIIHKTLRSKIIGFLKNIQKFEKGMRPILIKPVRLLDQEIISYFIEKIQFLPQMVPALLLICLTQSEKEKEIDISKTKEILQRLIQEHPDKQYFKDKITEKLNKLGYEAESRPNCEDFFKFLENLWRLIHIKENNYVFYLQGCLKIENERIKQIYLNTLCQKVKITERDLEKYLIQEFKSQTKSNQVQNIRKIVTSKYYKNQEEKSLEEMAQQVWKCFLQNPQKTALLVYKYDKHFKDIMKTINRKIETEDFFVRQPEIILSHLTKIPKNIQNNLNIRQIEKKALNLRNIQRQIKDVKQICSSFDSLKEEANKIENEVERNLSNFKAKDLNPIIFKYNCLNKISFLLKILINFEGFNKDRISDIDSLVQEYNKTRDALKIKMIYADSILVKEFQTIMTYFDEKTLKKIIVENEHQEELNRYQNIKKYRTILHEENIDSVKETLKAIYFFKINFEEKQSIQRQTYNILEGIKEVDEAEKVKDLVQIIEKMKEISQKILKASINDPKVSILRATSKCSQLFIRMDSENLSRQKLQQLVEYSNQMQSITNINTHREFQKVFEYWTELKKCKTISNALKTINKFIDENNSTKDLDRYIKNCYHNQSWLFQELKKSSNLEFQYKKEVESILKDSNVVVRWKNCCVQILIKVKKNNIEGRDHEYSQFGFSKLSFLMNKSMWDQSSSRDRLQQLEPLQIEHMKALKTYQSLFRLIQQIKNICNKLVDYSYDPKLLQRQLKVKQSRLEQIFMFRNQLQKISENWIQDIKQIISKSYIGTHFTGPTLVQLVESIEKNGSYEGLEKLEIISSEKIKKEEIQYLQKQFKEKFLSLIQKIQLIHDTLSFDKINRKGSVIQKIKLITIGQQHFYGYAFKENGFKIPNFNQILVCREDTKIQEFEFFLDRAMINSSQNYFIFGVHRIAEEIKDSFCCLIKAKKEQRSKDFACCRLIFIDDDFNNQIIFLLNQPQLFFIEKNLNEERQFSTKSDEIYSQLLRQLNTSILITSVKAGLGKTHYVEKIGRATGKKVIHFVIPGTINYQSLAFRLKKQKFQGKQILLLKIGYVVDKKKLEIFLSSLIVFRHFFYNQYISLHPDTQIYIQIQNIFSKQMDEDVHNSQILEKQYHILNILRHHKVEEKIENFDIQMLDFEGMNNDEEFVLNFLDHIIREQKYLDNFDYKKKVENAERKKQILRKYFVQYMRNKNLEPTYIMYKFWMKSLYQNFLTFSQHPLLGTIAHIQQREDNQLKQYIQVPSTFLSQYRYLFLKTCIENSLNLVEETYTQNLEKNQSQQKRTFRKLLRQSSLIIIPEYNNDKHQFICMNDEKVPRHIKLMNLSQTPQLNSSKQRKYYESNIDQYYRDYCSLNAIKDSKDLQEKMIHILLSLARDQKEIGNSNWLKNKLQAMPKDYVLTKDNFFKMCLIIQREKCNSPCVIEGESGVGKTALIKFLGQHIYGTKILIFNITAGTGENDLKTMIQEIKQTSLALSLDERTQNKKVWVFFDEFNTTDEVSYIKQIMMENSFMGEDLPDNLFFIAACNPYRLKQQKVLSAGLQMDKSENQMAFKVNPPPNSMILIMWDYQQLNREETLLYIQKILEKLDYKKKNKLIATIIKLHEFIKDKIEASAVSLRDIKRFQSLFIWFEQYLKYSKQIKHQTRSQDHNGESTTMLALGFCYCLRISNNQQRQNMMRFIEQEMSWKKESMQKVLEEEQTSFIKMLKLPENIVVNHALKQNVFTTFVCIMNKIPVLIIGCPGSSKSLSVRIIISNFFGKRSDIECKIASHYPEINMFYFQGSVSSTSEGVQQIFNRVKMMKKSEEFNYRDCIYFDEIGLAEKSPHNPLKVLHSKLEINNQNNVSFIGISNYALDLSKMSRFLVLNRPLPTIKENRETAKLIFENQVKGTNNKSFKEKVEKIGQDYTNFLFTYEGIPQARKGLFGLRDFYSMVTEVCQNIKKDSHFEQLYYNAVCHNFDGQQGSLKLFRSAVAQMNDQTFERRHIINSNKLILQNLQNPNSRSLLLIVQKDTMIPIIAERIRKKTQRNVNIIYGSGFKEDESSQSYNSEVTYKVMKAMAQGDIVIFKDINASIQTSLYDLFNKSYVIRQNKKVCRIAVGANSNPQCFVHPNFNSIVFIERSKLYGLDLPFLNRFEKHALSSENIIDKNQIKKLNQWINKITTHQNLKKQNLLFNITEESLITLILKFTDGEGNYKESAMKKEILQNRTIDFDILQRYNLQMGSNNEFIDIDGLQDYQNDKEDLILFTYHQLIDSEERHKYEFLKGSNLIRIAEINSEMSLTDKLKSYLQSTEKEKCLIYLNYSHHHNLIQQILFLSKKIKEEQKSKAQIVVIAQFYRCDIFNNYASRSTISYLHPFSQYFVERFDMDIRKICENGFSYFILYDSLKLSEQIGLLFNNAVSLIKIVVQDHNNSQEKIFIQIANLIQNNQFQKYLKEFIKEALKNIKVNYKEIHEDFKSLRECPSILEALEKITKEITIKVIFIVIQVIVSGDYLSLFQMNKMEVQGEEEFHYQIKKHEFEEELSNIQRNLKQSEENIFKEIKKDKNSNIIKKRKCNYNFKKMPDFLQNMAKSMIKVPEKQDNLFTFFQNAFEENLNKNIFLPLKNFFINSNMHNLIISDVLTWKFSFKHLDVLNFLTNFLINKIDGSLDLKIWLFFTPTVGEKIKIQQGLNILEIILQYHNNSQILLDEFKQSIKLKEQQLGNNILRPILKESMNLLKFSYANMVTFNGPLQMSKYAKNLIEKLFKLFEMTDIDYSSDHVILIHFHQFLNEIQADSTILEEFIKFEPSKPIYNRIYNYIMKRISSDPEHKNNYESFLSFKLFECWIQQFLTKQYNIQEIESFINQYIEWCNQSKDFAIRSYKFFKKLFINLSGNEPCEQISDQLAKFGLTEVLNAKLKSYSYFSIALNNFFIKMIIEDRDQKNLLLKQWNYFSKIMRNQLDPLTPYSVVGSFKIAFLKVYLSCYLNLMIKGQALSVMSEINSILGSEYPLKFYFRIFLLKLLKNIKTKEEIKREFIEVKRCSWIDKDLLEIELIQPDLLRFIEQNCDYSQIDTKYEYLYLFKNVKIIMSKEQKEQNSLAQLIFNQFWNEWGLKLKQSYPLLDFILSSMNRSKLLENIIKMMRFLSKIKRLAHLNIRKIQKQKSISQFIRHMSNMKERSQMQNELQQYLQIRHYKRQPWEEIDPQLDLTFFEKLEKLTKDDPLSKFLMIKNDDAENNEVFVFVQNLAKTYNKICSLMKTAIQKVKKNHINMEIQEKIDPTELNDNIQLIEIPIQNACRAISTYSTYSIEMNNPNLIFFLEQIQSSLLNKLKPIRFLKQKSEQFSEFIFFGESKSFLVEMKRVPTNKTLKEIDKDKLIEEYFKKEKQVKPKEFAFTISQFLQRLETIMVYIKNQERSADLTLEMLYEKCNLTEGVFKELKKEPFCQLPLVVIVDLYEYVESLSFEDQQNSLTSDFKIPLPDLQKKQLDKVLTELKKNRDEKGNPLYDNFKRAFNRFVLRKVLKESCMPTDTLREHLCLYNEFWDRGTEMMIEELNQYKIMELEVKYVHQILVKIRENEKKKIENVPMVMPPRFLLSNKKKASLN